VQRRERRASLDSEQHLRPVLRRAWEQPFTTRSNFAREGNIEAIFQAIELGYLTTRRGQESWTNVVRITPAGLAYLNPFNYTPQEADAATAEENV
jgi:hypothetical protein